MNCKAIFTTHELIDLSSAIMVKNQYGEEPFVSDKLLHSLLNSLRGHKKAYEAANEITATVTQKVLKSASNGLVLAHTIGIEASGALKRFDKQAYLRYMAEHPSLDL